jgi:hypothetical protein
MITTRASMDSARATAALRVVAGELGIGPGTAVANEPRESVVRNRLGPEHLSEASFCRAAVHVHLPEPVLRLDEALGEE